MRYSILVMLLLALFMTGCLEEETDAVDDGYQSYTQEEELDSCPAGTTAPYGDYQLDSQCQTACSYLSVGQMDGVNASCDILVGWESHTDISASDCGACGGTTSTSSNDDYYYDEPADTTQYTFCAKETNEMIYYSCQDTSCSYDYYSKGTYSSQSSCVSAGESWLDTFRYGAPSRVDSNDIEKDWNLCIDNQTQETTCSRNECLDEESLYGSYANTDECDSAAQTQGSQSTPFINYAQ